MPITERNSVWIRSVKNGWNLFKEAVDMLHRIAFIVTLLSLAYPGVLEWIVVQSRSPQADLYLKVIQAIRESPWSSFSRMIVIATFILGVFALLVSVMSIVVTKRVRKPTSTRHH